ncbi:MAG: hypothetical protein GY898_31560 [Proteobacteria bacterium]|nr:hypothetical protein [Pseudomonadota bacterium]
MAITALFVGIVQTRTDGADLFVGADRGVFWAEHVERLVAVSNTEAAWPAVLEGNREAAENWVYSVDQRFPPGLYLWGAIVGRIFSHEAEVVCRSMSAWWLLLAAAAGLLTSRIAEGVRWSFVAGYAATLSIPSLGSLSLTYFFDLPMIAMIWTALAAWMLLERWPPVAGVVAGTLLFLAGLFKWTALPIGGLMLACVAAAGLIASWDRKRCAWSLLGLALAAGTMGGAFWQWLQLGGQSFDYMLTIMASATVSAQVRTWELGPWTLVTVEWENRRLAWYAVRSLTQVIGPLSAIPLALGAFWGARGRAGWLCLLIVAVHAVFVLVLVPSLDARFLMTATPAIAIVAAVGWLQRGPWGATLAAATLLAGGITLAEFHHGERNAWNRIWPTDPTPEQPLAGRGIFLDVGDRLTGGWPKAESTHPYAPEREAVWDALTACDQAALLVPSDALGTYGDAQWLAYRQKLARLQDEPSPEPLFETGAAWGEAPLPEFPERVLLLLGAVGQEPPPARPGWTLQGRYTSEERVLTLWALGEGPRCDLEGRLGWEVIAKEAGEAGCGDGDARGHGVTPAATARQPLRTPDGSCDELGPRCVAPYLVAAERLSPQPADCGGRLRALAAARAMDRSNDVGDAWSEGRDWPASQLAEALRGRLTLREPRALVSWDSPPVPVPGGERQEIVLEDELLGPQRVVLFLPPGPGPHPAVVGLLGHDQSVEQFMAGHAGQELLEAGVAVAVPVVRGYDSNEAEDQAARAMLCADSSMMAVRVSEARNALRLLRSRPEVCDGHLGILAHSGGSLVANLLVWIEPDLRGIVTDMEGHYNGAREATPPDQALLRDETHLGLRSVSRRLIDFRDAPVPTLRVRYGMPDGAEQVVEFLDAALRSETRVEQPPPLPPPQ